MSKFIAERILLFSIKGNSKREKVRVVLHAPCIVKSEDVDFPINGIISKCRVEFLEKDEWSFDVYGADSIQALNLASNIDPIIKRLSSKFDFYWESGDPYFE